MPSPRPANWPLADQQMWNNLLAAGCPLDENGGLSHVRPTTVAMLQNAYRQWLHWLAISEPEAFNTDPVERATLSRLRRWHDQMESLRPMSKLVYIGGTVRILRAAAPDVDWSNHTRLLRHLKRLAGDGDRGRKSGRVLDSGRLLEAGIRYAGTSAKVRPTPLEAAMRFQTGLMIAMLALMPLRSSPFRRLELGSSIRETEFGIEVMVPGEMMKSGLPWDAKVPEVLMPLLRRYLDEVRPWLLKRRRKSHSFLWVTSQGDPFKNGYIGVRVALAAIEATGTRVSPHLFRDAAATTMTRLSRQSARLIKPILAHTSAETAEHHYIHAGTIEAGRNYAALIREKRKRS